MLSNMVLRALIKFA